MIDRLNVAEWNVGEASVPTIEQQPFDDLAAIDLHQQSVISAGFPQDTKRDAHK
ncbi:hypothetical protein [Chthoniobacter flavus]|uniref:hypothetical protein n=1 Tax=Chthoniobacter flavus TaxID=191863 RepID=UPI001ED942CD|nr:hypothetical protein [Chthoniobacter flavus]